MGSERPYSRGAADPRQSRIDRRTFLRIAGTGSVVATVAGCSDDSGETAANDTGDTGATEDEGDDEDSESTDEIDENGDGEIADETLTIGHLAPLEFSVGTGSMRSAELAAADLVETGRADATVRTMDTGANAVDAAAAAQRLIDEEGADLLVGGFVDPAVYGIIDVVQRYDVPYIVTGTGTPAVLRSTVGESYDRYRNVFRTGPINCTFQAELLSDYASFLADAHDWTSFALLTGGFEWGRQFRQRLPALIEDRGFDVVSVDTVPPDVVDFSRFLADIEDSDADAVLRSFKAANDGTFVTQWQKGKYTFGVEGRTVTSPPLEYLERTAGACRYTTSAQAGAYGIANPTDRTRPFLEAYEDEYAGDGPSVPMEMGFNTYDAIQFYARAVEEAGTLDYENNLDDIVDAMLSLEYEGAAGEISLDGEGDTHPHDVRPTRNGAGEITNLPVTQWQATDDSVEQECVFPRRYATADHVAPHWI